MGVPFVPKEKKKSIEQHQLWGKENLKASHIAVHRGSCIKEGGRDELCRSVDFSVNQVAR